MKKERLQQRRDYNPHHGLRMAAWSALEAARTSRVGSHYNLMVAMTFSALAIEAICNSFGHHAVANWGDFESASPIAKLRVICSALDVKYDAKKHPWSDVAWLMWFRNRIVHAKPENIEVDMVLQEAASASRRYQKPLSKLESEITRGNAERAYNAMNEILETFAMRVPPENLGNLLGDGWNGEVSVV